MTTTPETRYARTADGTHVAYQVHGEGPVDILVLRAWHSNLDHEWKDPVLAGVYRRLGSVGRVIRLDRRGTGLSDRYDPASPPTLEDRIDDIRAALDAAGAERIVAVGLAHGGALCTYFAAAYPERTMGLVLWSSPPSMTGHVNDAAYDAERDEIRHGWGTIEAARETARIVGPSRADDAAFIEWIRNDALTSGTVDEAIAQWMLVRQTSVAGILPSIHVPTLVMWRGGSWSVGPQVAALIPSARALPLPGEDHMLISGDWRRPLGEIESFIASVAELHATDNRVLATGCSPTSSARPSERRLSETGRGASWSTGTTAWSDESSRAIEDGRSTSPATASSRRSTVRPGLSAARPPSETQCASSGSS
jgi:pimeloyl-ACP methyl ester carboxylesterase